MIDKEYKRKYLIIYSLLFIVYLLFGYGVTITNDSVSNIDQIVSLDLSSRSSHFTFHFLGIVFYLLFSKLLVLSVITAVEIMLAFVSSLGSISLFHIVLKKYGNYQQSLIAVLIYAFSSGIFRFSCQAEYLILVPSLGLISLAMYSSSKSLTAGFIFGLGILTSPFIFLLSPVYFLFSKFKDVTKRNNILFLVGMIIIYFGVNVFTYKQTLSGNWSYGQIFFGYIDLIKEINLVRQFAILIYGYFRSFNFLLLLLPFALYYSFKVERRLFWIFIISFFLHLPIAIPEARYGGYQMTMYPLISILLSSFLLYLYRTKKLVVRSIVIIYISINLLVVFIERSFYVTLKETYCSLNNDLKPGSVLFLYRATKPINNLYAPNLKTINILTDYQEQLAEYEWDYSKENISSIISHNTEFYLLESGVSWPDDYIKLFFSNFTEMHGAKVKGFGLRKLEKYIGGFQIVRLENYKLDVYKITH